MRKMLLLLFVAVLCSHAVEACYECYSVDGGFACMTPPDGISGRCACDLHARTSHGGGEIAICSLGGGVCINQYGCGDGPVVNSPSPMSSEATVAPEVWVSVTKPGGARTIYQVPAGLAAGVPAERLLDYLMALVIPPAL